MNLNIAVDLEDEILVRLPIKSLVRFKSVCKRWHSLIEEPSFITRYNRLAKSRNTSKLLCFGKHPITRTRFANVSSSAHDHETTTITIEDLEFPPLIDDGWVLEGVDPLFLTEEYIGKDTGYIFVDDIHVIGPVNGIYCIFHRKKNRWGGTLILWNPATRSYKHILPPISFPFPLHEQRWFAVAQYQESDPLGLHIGFGYDDTVSDYKVVAIFHWDVAYVPYTDENWHVRVYNNATDVWITICSLRYFAGEDELPFTYVVSQPEICNCFQLHGNCHWSCAIREREAHVYDVSQYAVLAFDMVQHTFKVMRGPPIPPDEYNIRPSVWVLQETIVMVAKHVKEEKVEVWIMREYGVDDSWNLLLSIANVGEFDVVGIPNDDERIFLGDKNGRLISYRIDDDRGVEIKPLEDYHGDIGVFNYEENLVPINRINIHH